MARGDAVIEGYLDDKFIGGDDSTRFRDERGEYHASRIGSCPREWHWLFEKGKRPEASPYFELGDYYETIYGDALKNEYGEDRVVQDVECSVEFDDFTIVGESDWVVLTENPEYTPAHVTCYPHTDLPRRVTDASGSAFDVGSTNIDHVVETKTIGSIDWVGRYGVDQKYMYQVSTYMLAFGVGGVVAYMERNDLSEEIVPVERDDAREMDIYLRAKRQHDALGGAVETPLPARPPKEKHCDWCQYTEECKQVGGARWDEWGEREVEETPWGGEDE